MHLITDHHNRLNVDLLKNRIMSHTDNVNHIFAINQDGEGS